MSESTHPPLELPADYRRTLPPEFRLIGWGSQIATTPHGKTRHKGWLVYRQICAQTGSGAFTKQPASREISANHLYAAPRSHPVCRYAFYPDHRGSSARSGLSELLLLFLLTCKKSPSFCQGEAASELTAELTALNLK